MNRTNKDNRFLAEEPIGKLLFRLSVPTIAAQLINMLYNIVDRIYLGHMPGNGDLALTGVGVCMPIILLMSAFAALVGSGGAPRASIYMGQGNRVDAEKTMGSCFTLQLLLAVVCTIGLLLFHRPLLLSFGASSNTIGYASSYMRVYALGTVFVQITLAMNAYITAQGYTKIGMFTVLIGALSNIILDPIFIFGLQLGVAGAALATILSQGISCLWVVKFLCSDKSLLRLKKETLAVRMDLALPCLALGVAPFVMQSSESVISVCFNSSLLQYGGDIAVGAMTILTSVMQFAMMPLQGLSQGAQPIISYNFGARNRARVKQVFLLLLTVSLVYSCSLWALIMLFPRLFAGIFTPDPDLLNFAAGALRIYCGAMGLLGIQIACQMTFLSLGKAGASTIVAIVRKFVLLMPLIYLLPHFLPDKTTAVYMAEPAADMLAVAFTSLLFSIQFRAALRSLEEPPSS